MSDPTASDRTLDAFRKLVRHEDPQRTYQGLHEYAVQRADARTFDGTPTDADYSPELPTQVPYRPALAGSSCVPAVGTLAYVMFANCNASKPVLVGFGPTLPESSTVDASETGTVNVGPTAALTMLGSGSEKLDLGAELGRFVRYGDHVTIPAPGGPAAGTITQAVLTAPNDIAKVKSPS